MSGEGFDLELGQPAAGEPAPGGEGTAGGEPAPLPDLVELRGPEWSAEVERNDFDAFAGKLGMDPDELRRVIQIGRDGNRLYEKVNDEWDRIRAARDEMARGAGDRGEAVPSRAAQPPTATPLPRAGDRPKPDDVIGTMQWLAERAQAQDQLLARIPEIENLLTQTGRLISEREFASDVAEERAVAHDAYDSVADMWKKQGYTLPPRGELERLLQRIPLSEDPDLTWYDIWNHVGWMAAGPQIARFARRRAVLDSQKPDARITVPAATGAPARAPALNPNGSVEEQLAAMEGQIGRLTVGETLLPRD